MPDALRVPETIPFAIFLRLGMPSCFPAPLGPMRLKRNGGVTSSSATDSVRSRPPLAQQPFADDEVALGSVVLFHVSPLSWRASMLSEIADSCGDRERDSRDATPQSRHPDE